MKKKIFAALAAAMMLGTTLAAPVSAAETYQKGDVNMDGVVDVADSLIVLQEYCDYICGHECTFSQEQIKLTEIVGITTVSMNGKTSIPFSVADSMIILQYYICKDVVNIIDNSVSIDSFFQNRSYYIQKMKMTS